MTDAADLIRRRFEALDPVLDEQGRRRSAEAARSLDERRSDVAAAVTSKSLDKLCASLKAVQHSVCANVVADLLRTLGYSLQSNRKTREGSKHPDRDAQFQYLDAHMKEHMTEQSSVTSVDTKKKELVGDFKNAGRELRPKASPEEVRVHGFIDPELGRAVPYGIYDIAVNKGWVSVGIDHDTAALAVKTIRRWWNTLGTARYPYAKRLMITADGGGSNGARVRLWKFEL